MPGTHINIHAEQIRKYFVDHEGQQTITVFFPGYELGKGMDISPIFDQFSKEIKKRTKADVYGIFVDDTSVATPMTKIISEINLMDRLLDVVSLKSFYWAQRMTGII